MKTKRLHSPLALLFATALFHSLTAHASLLATDSFHTTSNGAGGTYSTSAPHTDQRLWNQGATSNVSGFSGAWTNANTTATAAVRVMTTGLTHALLAGSSSEGAVRFQNGGSQRGTTRAFDSTVTTAIGTAPDLYFSGLFWTGADLATAGHGIYFGLGPNQNDSASPASINSTGVYLRYQNDGFAIGMRDTTNTTFTNTAIGFDPAANNTHLFVLGITFDHSPGVDRVNYWIYNEAATDPLAPSASGFVDGKITRASLSHLVVSTTNLNTDYATNTITPRVDEFRLGTTLDSVVVIPEPGTLVLLALGLGYILHRRRKG